MKNRQSKPVKVSIEDILFTNGALKLRQSVGIFCTLRRPSVPFMRASVQTIATRLSGKAGLRTGIRCLGLREKVCIATVTPSLSFWNVYDVEQVFCDRGSK